MTKSNDYVGMRRERRHFSLTKQNIQDFDDNFLIQHSINNCFFYIMCLVIETRSSWLNCALRDDEAVYWVSIGHYEAVAVGN